MSDTIPDEIADLMTDEELAEMRSRNGWAVGTVTEVGDDGSVLRTIEEAWVELFNGEGLSGAFGGVRFQAVDENGDYTESYAYATEEAAEENTTPPYWFVESYDTEDVDYGQPAP